MNARCHFKSFITFTLPVVAALVLVVPVVRAQTLPGPTNTTFNATIDAQWTNAGNWDSGVPTSTDNALIADTKTAFYNNTGVSTAFFGTLTLGVGSTFQLQTGGNQGLPTGSNVYFQDGSILEYTAGSSNRDDNFYIVPGASATFKTATGTFFRGTLQGAGNLTVIV